jgi:hypothetical protein
MLLKSKILIVIVIVEILTIVALIFQYFNLSVGGKLVYVIENENGKYKFFNVCDVTRRHSRDKDLYMELIPNFHVACPRGNKRIFIDINSEGFRDKEFSLNKPANTIRILAMGDSFTYGWYVNLNDTWPKKLEKLLNENSKGSMFEVLNLGITGYDIWNVANLFVKRGYIYNPDALLISFIDNDVVPESKFCFNECINISSNKTQCQGKCHIEIMYEFIRNHTHIFEYINKSFSLIRSNYGGKIYLVMFPLNITFPLVDESYEYIINNLAAIYNIKICKIHEIYKKWPLEKLVLDKKF